MLELKFDELSQAGRSRQSESRDVVQLVSNANTLAVKLEQRVGKLQEIIDRMNRGEFEWRIKGWAEMRTQARDGINQIVYSSAFFSHVNGYKLCLRVDPAGHADGEGTHLSLFFCIMRGPFDDVLPWPFKRDVGIILMNPQTGVAHLKLTAKYSAVPGDQDIFAKPSSERNRGFGFPKFIELAQMSSSSQLCYDNQIFIKCSVDAL